MHSFVPGREIAPACRYGCMLFALRSGDLDRRTNRVPIASVPNQIQSEPVILGLGFVIQNVNWTAVLRDNRVEPSVIINVPDCHSSACPGLAKDGSGFA